MKRITILLFLCISISTFAQSLEGTWKMSPQAGAMGVGPNQGDTSWWSSGIGDVTTRACFFDDEYIFNTNGTFNNVQGAQTWTEGWQGVTDSCGTPVAPHNGSNAATYTYNTTNNTITLSGVGAYLGLAKVYNGGELTSPANAPSTITYTISSLTSTNLTLDISIGGGWWRFILAKQGVPNCSDGIQNGTETGIDCGGTCTPCVTTPMVNAATPTKPAGDVVSVYSDSYSSIATNFNPFWGQSGSVNTTYDPTGNGTNYAMAYTNFNYQGTEVTAQNLANMEFLHVDVWIDADPSSTILQVSPINSGSGSSETLVTINHTQGAWTSVDIPKSSFTGMTWDNIIQMKFAANGAGSTTPVDIYLDNIYFWKTNIPTAAWDGTMWIGTPSSSTALIFNGNYTHNTPTVLEGLSCTINGTSVVTFNSGTLNIQNNLNTEVGTSLIIESDANLVQVNSMDSNNVLGTFTSKRNSANMIRLDYTAWSSPVIGQNALVFSPGTLTNRFYEYDPNANSYSIISPSSTNFTIGKGLLVRAPNTWSSSTPAAYPGVFTGVPNNGDLTTTVLPGYNLLGNPYASPISANSLLANTNNNGLGITTLYFWTHTLAASANGTYASSNYATHNGTIGVAAAAGGAIPDGNIQVGQGFFVNATMSGSIEFNNNMRLTTHNGQFFKTSNTLNQPTIIEKHGMWFDLTSTGKNHNQIYIGYIQGASNSFDNSFDSKLFGQTSSALYSPISNDKYVIQGRALPFSTTDVVPLGLIIETPGQYTIELNSFDGLFAGQNIYLKDNLLNITHDIKNYSYSFTSNTGEFASRFEIVYGAQLSVETSSFNENSVIVYNGESGITINSGITLIDSVKIFDVRGRLLVTKSSVNANTISIENVTADKQVLIVQVTSLNNEKISKKVIK